MPCKTTASELSTMYNKVGTGPPLEVDGIDKLDIEFLQPGGSEIGKRFKRKIDTHKKVREHITIQKGSKMYYYITF